MRLFKIRESRVCFVFRCVCLSISEGDIFFIVLGLCAFSLETRQTKTAGVTSWQVEGQDLFGVISFSKAMKNVRMQFFSQTSK